jgi:hypothetical protein
LRAGRRQDPFGTQFAERLPQRQHRSFAQVAVSSRIRSRASARRWS